MNRDTLARTIYERTHLTGEFRLRSGAVSNEYFDKYLFESDPSLLREIGEALVPLLPPGTDALAGLELGGVPLATMLSQLTGLPALFVRKEAKTYGTCRLAEGGELDGRRLTVVEDVVTSGGQVVTSSLFTGQIVELEAGTLRRFWTVKVAPATRYVAISLWPG